MAFTNTQDLLYLVGAICLLWVSGFICWVLFEIGWMVHQANSLVSDTRKKISMIEEFVSDIGEKLASLSTYVNVIGQGAKMLMGATEHKKSKKSKRGMPSLDELDEE